MNNEINKQITNILTNTKDSDNHCKKYKNFTQFPSEEIPRKCTVSTDPWKNHPKNLQRRSKPSPPPNDPPPLKKIPLLENQAKLSNSLSSDILQKGDVNHMKPT